MGTGKSTINYPFKKPVVILTSICFTYKILSKFNYLYVKQEKILGYIRCTISII